MSRDATLLAIRLERQADDKLANTTRSRPQTRSEFFVVIIVVAAAAAASALANF